MNYREKLNNIITKYNLNEDIIKEITDLKNMMLIKEKLGEILEDVDEPRWERMEMKETVDAVVEIIHENKIDLLTEYIYDDLFCWDVLLYITEGIKEYAEGNLY